MRQTLTLLGVLQLVTVRNLTPRLPPESARLRVDLFLALDRPEGTRPSPWFHAEVFDAELPQHEAVHRARPGDRVEIVGHWHGFDCWDPSGNLGAIQVFMVERFRVVGG